MGNCTGKQSKSKKSELKEEVYKPSDKKLKEEVDVFKPGEKNPDINESNENLNGGGNGVVSEAKEEKFESMQNNESTDAAENLIDDKNVKSGDTSASNQEVMASEKESNVASNTIPSNREEISPIKPEGQSAPDNTDGGGDKQEKEKSSITAEKTRKDKETRVDKLEFTDLDRKPYLFAHGTPMETEFIDTKSKPADNVDKTETDPPNLGTQDRDDNQRVNENPISDNQSKETVDTNIEDSTRKDIPGPGEGKMENQQPIEGEKTGYNKSQFSHPGDEQDEKMSEQHKHDNSSENPKKSKKKKKKKKDPWDPPQNAQVVNYYGDVKTLNVGCKNVTVKEEDTKPTNNVNIQPTFVITQQETLILNEVSKSVGFIKGECLTGTCWRVGDDKIITAFHVVSKNILVSDSMHEPKLSKIEVTFDYVDNKNDCSTSDNVFKVEPKVIYSNESLDVAVLQLKKNEKKPFPEPLRKFHFLDPKTDADKKIFLISHDKGKKKSYNGDIGLWTPTEKGLKDLEKFCIRNGWENGYTELDKEGRLVLKCQFEGGASGSPGIILLNDKPYVVLLYIRGFPDFYYSKQFPEEKKRTFPSDKILQQGVGIISVFKEMSNNHLYLRLRNEIFPEEAEQESLNSRHQYAMGGYNIGKPGISQNIKNNAEQNEQSVPVGDNKSRETIQTPMTCTDDIDDSIAKNSQDTVIYSRQASLVLPSGKNVTHDQSQIVLSGQCQNFNLRHYTGSDGSQHLNAENSTEDVTDIAEIHQHRTKATLPDQDPETDVVAGEKQLCGKNQGNTQPIPHLTFDEWIGTDFQVHKDKSLNKDLNLQRISRAISPNALGRLGSLLGYQTVDIDTVKTNHERNTCFHLLIKWRNKIGHAATLDKLVHILYNLSKTENVNVDYLKDAISNFQT